MYAYLFWDKIRPKMAKILQFYVITDQNCKPVCSYLRVYVYLRAQSNMKYGPFQLLIRRRSYVQKPTRSPQSKLKLAAVFSVLMKNHS